jgi:hypothetical protein
MPLQDEGGFRVPPKYLPKGDENLVIVFKDWEKIVYPPPEGGGGVHGVVS